ncbi:DUF998 domain-containing protein [Shewanella corallii]|uniref:DUF998 domain-containing protein n=1 Tax=Shewanella corallii TaxID=560080 RepID=A0ABT0N4A8_9GAMM|nr:DUF998 domain-containing protein [Shewanella corallii]MCL2913253.1 DUF998 domain-containing protein [Shewanella corallii]
MLGQFLIFSRHEWIRRLPLISYLWLVFTVLVGGLFYPDYSHISQYMSELGATGAPHAWLVNYLGFVPTEILLLVFLAMALPVLPQSVPTRLGIGLIGIYALLLIGASIFACDFECRPVEQASFAHGLHITLGTFAYLAGISGVLVTSVSARQWPGGFTLMMAGVAVAILAFGLLLNLNPDLPFVGLMQRAMETLMYLWFMLLGRTAARMA